MLRPAVDDAGRPVRFRVVEVDCVTGHEVDGGAKATLPSVVPDEGPQLRLAAELLADDDVLDEQADQALHVLRVDVPGVAGSEVPDRFRSLQTLEASDQRAVVDGRPISQSFRSLSRFSTMSTEPPR